MILEIVFYTVALVLGMKISIQEDMIFEKLGLYAEIQNSNGKNWVKPTILCHWCMPSVYSAFGFGIYFLIHGGSAKILFAYPAIVGISSFVAGFLWELLELVIIFKRGGEISNDLLGGEDSFNKSELYN